MATADNNNLVIFTGGVCKCASGSNVCWYLAVGDDNGGSCGVASVW